MAGEYTTTLLKRNIANLTLKKVSFRGAVPQIPSTTYGVFGLYRYPAKFIPQVVAFVLERYSSPGSVVLDPFAGSGTTGLVARLYGLEYELWDLNPLLKTLHAIAVMTPPSVEVARLVRDIRITKHFWLPRWSRLDYWYPQEAKELLGKLWGYYHHLEPGPVRLLLTIPLLKISKFLSYNDPQRQKLSRSPKSLARVQHFMLGDYREKVYKMVEQELLEVIEKLHAYQKLMNVKQHPRSRIFAGIDSVELSRSLPVDAKWDMIITSPPYLQAQEYIRASKLELFWLGYTEEEIRELARNELPYKRVEPTPIFSDQYEDMRSKIEEPHLRKMYEDYFYSVVGTLTRLSERTERYLFLFVGQATIRGKPVPIDTILAEHFQNIGWVHVQTLIDTIKARVMFRSKFNPANGIEDRRMPTEHMVILRR